MIEDTLVAILSDPTMVPDLTGITGTRVRPFTDSNVTPKPCLTYWRHNTDRPYSDDGPTGQAVARYQIDCWAADYLTAATAIRALEDLDGWRGTYNGTAIDFIRYDDQQDQINTPPTPGAQKAVQRCTAFLVISFPEEGRTFGKAFSDGFSSAFA